MVPVHTPYKKLEGQHTANSPYVLTAFVLLLTTLCRKLPLTLQVLGVLIIVTSFTVTTNVKFSF